MNITDLITPERVVCDSPATSKKRTLELLGELIADGQEALSAREIFESLIGRERLGSTGLGHGVALPHGRLNESERAIGAFVKLKNGVDFDAYDQQPVALVFGLLVPEHFTDQHLKILAHLAEMFSDEAFCRELMAAHTDRDLYDKLLRWRPAGAALHDQARPGTRG